MKQILLNYRILFVFNLYFFSLQKSYKKCHLWVKLQIVVLCFFTIVVMKRCNTTAVAADGYHFFEFILLAVSIYIYKIHHITFVYGLLEGLKNPLKPRRFRRSIFITKSAPKREVTPEPEPEEETFHHSAESEFQPVVATTSVQLESITRETCL